MTSSRLDVDALIDDRPDDHVFRVRRDVFRDPAVFEAEMTSIFEGTWVYVGLESQIAQPHDFFTTHIGRKPVLVTRDAAGVVRGFLNSCRHRGTIVCPFKAGRQKQHVCRYHGWAYDSGGRNILITDEADGQYAPSFRNENHDLFPVARIASYRGLIFASLSADVPTLEEHLGEARAFIDLAVDHGPSGLEYVPGDVTYTYDGNWKLQFENGLDFYHFASTHSSYVDISRRRPKDEAELALVRHAFGVQPEGHGTLGFARGHAVMWSVRNTPRGTGPLAYSAAALDALRARVGDTKAKWMVRQRNLTIFPNLQIIDISTSLQLRTWRPLAPDRTEMTSHCLAPIGEAREARRLRIRNYEDFFNPSGLATSDDNVMYEYGQAGYEADGDGWTQGYARGLGVPQTTPHPTAGELGLETTTGALGSLGFGDETCFHAGYREWRRLLSAARAPVSQSENAPHDGR